jgi:D-alanyl-D-alanine carboxypeptidase/D-alanyl-D-alanine-endopeptidase (penicillin-binding protein 4)
MKIGIRLPAALVLPLVMPLSGLAASPETAPAAGSIPALRERVQALVTQPRFARGHWGVHIISVESDQPIFSTNAEKLFIPASTAKLFTAALALDRLGAEFRIRTSAYAGSPPDAQGTVRGDLVVFGRGDPSFDAAAAGGDWDCVFAPLAESLCRAGVKAVTGNLVADASFFRGPAIGSGWEQSDLPWYYAAEVSALSLNDNAIEVIVRPARVAGRAAEVFLFPPASGLVIGNLTQTLPRGGIRRIEIVPAQARRTVFVRGQIPIEATPVTESVSVPRPAEWFGRLFKAVLERRGVSVRGRVVEINGEYPAPLADLGRLRELGFVESPPLRELLPRMLKPSQNLHAQLWLLQAGATEPPGGDTAEQAGLRALTRFLAAAGIGADEARFDEGSGLSRHNMVTPRALVQLLRFMARHPHAKVYFDALPVAGVDGTLKTRFRGTIAEGNLRAKTGSLDQVHTLAGLVTTKAGERLIFALMLNNYAAPPERPARAELDEIAVLLAELTQHSRNLARE